MQCRLVVDRDLFAGFDVAQCDEEDVVVEDLHEGVRHTGVIDVVRAVAAATAIQTPAMINLTNPQHLSMCSATGFAVCDLLAGVFRDLMSLLERYGGEAASAVYERRLDC